VTVRLPPRDRDAVRRLVEQGVFRNRSDFIRHAVKAALERYGAAPSVPDLTLEGVELPAADAPTRSRARGAQRQGR